MSCIINGDSIKNGMTSLLRDDLLKSGLFKEEDGIFVNQGQYFEAQSFTQGINRKFSQEVIKKLSDNRYEISIPDSLLKDYVVETKEGKEIVKVIGLYNDFRIEPNSWNRDEMFTYLNYPEITEMTNEKLKSFLTSLNPNFKVEEIDNLSVPGVASIKNFLIQVRTMSKLSAMPEEVAHVLIGLLPDNNALKTDMLANITSYPIYSQTLAQYKGEYLKEDGTPDYDKIKTEASGKLVAEYIHALSSGDNTRLDVLGKPKQGFLRTWFNKFLKWLGIGMLDHTSSYADIAGLILSGENDQTLKTAKEIEDISYTNSYFFRLSEDQLYDMTGDILAKNPPELLNIINNFTKQFSKGFREILKDEQFNQLNEELKRDNSGIGKINRLSEIQSSLKDASFGLKEALDSESFAIGVKQFLESVDRLGILSDSILKVINSKEKAKGFDEAIKNIKELEAYFGIYETFINTISSDLADSLIRSGVGSGVVNTILSTQTNFETVNKYILDKLRDDLFIFYKEMLSNTNQVVAETLQEDIDRATELKNPKLIQQTKDRMKNLIQTDEKIIKMLSGKGNDIDSLSVMNHLLNASVVNGDLYVAGISKHIQNQINQYHQYAKIEQRNLYDQVDPIQKKLKEPAHVTGKAITFSNTIPDQENPEGRQVLTFLNPFKGIEMAEKGLIDAKEEARKNLADADKNNKDEYDAYMSVFKEKQADHEDFKSKYMNRIFVKEYYEFNKKYDENPLYIQAREQYNEFTRSIQGLEEYLKLEPENDDLWEEFAVTRRERANLLSEADLNGDDKTGDELAKVQILNQYFKESNNYKELDEVQTERSYLVGRGRYEQKIDFAIQEVKKFNPKNIEQVEAKMREVVKDNRLRFSNVYNLSAEEGDSIDYPYIKKLLMDKWYSKNITIQRNEKFFEDEKALRDELAELQKKGELTSEEETINIAYQRIRSILFGSRDQIGEINPDSLSDENKADIQALEDLIADLRQERPGLAIDMQDLTPEDRAQVEDLDRIINDPDMKPARKRAARLKKAKVLKKYKNTGKSKAIKDIINILGAMTEKVPTQYYWTKMTQFIQPMAEFAKEALALDLDDSERAQITQFSKDFVTSIDDQDHDKMDFELFTRGYFDEFLGWVKQTNLPLYEWFTDNHEEKNVYDPQNERYVKLPFVRGTIYNYKSPTIPEHQKIVYNKRFQKTKVKDEFRTGYDPVTKEVNLKEGVHISNMTRVNGSPVFLPLSPEQGEPVNSPYRNEEYYKLRDSQDPKDQLRFQYLETLKQAYLTSQEGLPSVKRRWMNVPVMELSHIESLQHLPTKAKQQIDNLKSVFKKNEAASADAQLAGYDTLEDPDLRAQADEDEEIDAINTKIRDTFSSLPKLSMAQRLPIERVSKNTLASIIQFMTRSQEFQGLREAQPVINTLNRVMRDNNFKGNTSNKERAKIFEKIYAQQILQQVPEGAINSRAVRRVARFLTGNTALRMIADPVGGVINYASAMVNTVVEASAGKYMNFQELAKGKVLAGKVDIALMSDFNNKANLSYYTLLYQTFDFIQGDFEEDLLERASSMNKKAAINQLLMIPRKTGELFAQSATAMGILERNKAVNSIDGKTYPMHEIYRKIGNNLELKEGFPQEYNPMDGKTFLHVKELINRVNQELHGNYAKISQSDASRYAIGKLAENMKRWFMPAFQRRFGRQAADITYEDLNEGYYRTAARAGYNYFSSLLHLDFGGAKSQMSFFINTPRYRENLKRMGAEAAQALILFLTFALLLGYYGDDKNKELDNNSWIHNMSILLALRVYSETTAYIPFPPFGFQEMKRNVLTPFSLPADAVSNFAAIAELGIYQLAYWFGADSLQGNLYYQKNSGYWYSQKGDSKLFKYMLRSAGFTGYTFEPKPYIKTFSNLQNRLK